MFGLVHSENIDVVRFLLEVFTKKKKKNTSLVRLSLDFRDEVVFLVIKHWLGLYLTSNIIFLSSAFRCPFNPNDYSSSSRILGEERSFVETIFLQTFQVSLKIRVSVYKSPHQLLLQHKVEQFQM